MRDSTDAVRPGVVRLLCTQNPLYVISAVLVLYGLRQCTMGNVDLTGGWILMGVICAYTSLLALAVAVIIRFARMWDDARMILLVLVLLFLALSVSFDKIVLSQPAVGSQFLLVGFVFSCLISESLLGVLRMRLAARYRVPYYLMLALLFGYPLLAAELSYSGLNEALAWSVYLFPWVAGFMFMTLLPAARAGAMLVRNNGTPWNWPLYPWTLFAFLWICLLLRTYSVTFAFEAPGGLHAYFQPHFLWPLLLAGAVVLLELGIAARSAATKAVALSVPALALPLTLISTSSIADGLPETSFLTTLCTSIGSPVQIAAWLLVGFYAVAWARGIRRLEAAVVGALLVCSVVTPSTWSFSTFSVPHAMPIQTAGLVLVIAGAVQRKPGKSYVGAVLALSGIALGHWDIVWPAMQLHRGYYTLHVLLLATALFAVISESEFAQWMRKGSVVWLPVLTILGGAAYDQMFVDVDVRVHSLYLIGMTLAAWGIWRRERTKQLAVSAVIATLANALPASKRLYLLLYGTVLGRGLVWIVIGFALLIVAVAVSFWRGGLLRPLWERLGGTQHRTHPPEPGQT